MGHIRLTVSRQREVELATELRAVNKAELIALFDEHFAAAAPSRQKAVSLCYSHSDAEAEGVPCEQ